MTLLKHNAVPLRRRPLATHSLRLLLRGGLLRVEFALLYLWFRIVGPPRLLCYRNEVNLWLLRAFGASVGRRNVLIQAPVTINNADYDFANLTIGDDVILNGNNFIDIRQPVTLERGVSLGPGVTIMTHNGFNDNPFLTARLERLCRTKPVVIKAGAGIKAHAVILHGVTVGEESVVAGGSVVSRSVPRRTYVSGVPAVVRKNLDLPD
jgi:acetyltransferase-like isoleucine patch superfamily enzyme